MLIDQPLVMTDVSYYCTTCIWQGENEFRCNWDFTGSETQEDAIRHLASILTEASEDPSIFEDDNGHEFNFLGMSPQQFAEFIVLSEEEAKDKMDTTWEISTKFQPVDPDNYEHPNNL